jgi:HPt (histidine-containing phosphotransfer) domain-containing protein
MWHEEQDLVDGTVLTALADDLHGRDDLAVRFAAEFIADLPARCARMLAACDADDRDTLFRAALSIRASAHMVGAGRLAADAQALRELALAAPIEACSAQAAVVERSANDTVVALIRVIAGFRYS